MLREKEKKRKMSTTVGQRTGWISSRCLVNCTRTAKNSTAGTAATRGYGARNESSYNPRSRRSAPVPLPLPLPFQVSFPFFHRAAGKQYLQVDRVNQQSFLSPITGAPVFFPVRLTYFFSPPSQSSRWPTRNTHGTTGSTASSRQQVRLLCPRAFSLREFRWPRNNGE